MRRSRLLALFTVAAAVAALFAFAPDAAACNQECILVSPGCVQCQTFPFYTGLRCRTSLDGCSCFYGFLCASSPTTPPAEVWPDFLTPEPELTPYVPEDEDDGLPRPEEPLFTVAV